MSDDRPDETWKPIPGWEGLYEASSEGRVRSVPREVPDGRLGIPTRRLKGKVLRPTHVGGYSRVTLMRESIPVQMLVHRAVLAAFTGTWSEGLACCHYDGDKTNNRVENLRWDTYSSNMFDQIRHGTHVAAAKSTCNRSHDLAGPNLVETYNVLKDGTKSPARECLACRKAMAFFGSQAGKGGGILPDRALLADAYYATIMASYTPPPPGEPVTYTGPRSDAKGCHAS